MALLESIAFALFIFFILFIITGTQTYGHAFVLIHNWFELYFSTRNLDFIRRKFIKTVRQRIFINAPRRVKFSNPERMGPRGSRRRSNDDPDTSGPTLPPKRACLVQRLPSTPEEPPATPPVVAFPSAPSEPSPPEPQPSKPSPPEPTPSEPAPAEPTTPEATSSDQKQQEQHQNQTEAVSTGKSPRFEPVFTVPAFQPRRRTSGSPYQSRTWAFGSRTSTSPPRYQYKFCNWCQSVHKSSDYCPRRFARQNQQDTSERPCSPYRTVNLHIPRCRSYGDCDICLSKTVLDWQEANDPKKTTQGTDTSNTSGPSNSPVTESSGTATRKRRNINLTRHQAEQVHEALSQQKSPSTIAVMGRIHHQLTTPLRLPYNQDHPARSPKKTTNDEPKTPEKSPQKSRPSSPSGTPASISTLSPMASPFKPRPVLSGSPEEADYCTPVTSEEISQAIRDICNKF